MSATNPIDVLVKLVRKIIAKEQTYLADLLQGRLTPEDERQVENRRRKLGNLLSRRIERAYGVASPTIPLSYLEPKIQADAPKKRGRKSHCDYRMDKEIVERWQRAKDAGVEKKQFAGDEGMSLKDLNRILNRHAKRAQRGNN